MTNTTTTPSTVQDLLKNQCHWWGVTGRCKHTQVGAVDGESFCKRHLKVATEMFNETQAEKARDAAIAVELTSFGLTFTHNAFWAISLDSEGDAVVFNDEEIQAFLAGLRFASKVRG